GGVHGVREGDDLDPHLGELLLGQGALRGASPVAALEEVGEAHLLPGLELRRGRLDVDLVREAQVADDLRALLGGDDGFDALDLAEHLAAHHPGDQHVALLTGTSQEVQVPDVEEVECSCCVTDPHGVLLLLTPTALTCRARMVSLPGKESNRSNTDNMISGAVAYCRLQRRV